MSRKINKLIKNLNIYRDKNFKDSKLSEWSGLVPMKQNFTFIFIRKLETGGWDHRRGGPGDKESKTTNAGY